MRDSFDRDIRYLRLSVTDACNLRCAYCIPDGAPPRLLEPLSVSEIENIVTTLAGCGIEKVRLTGGEPLVRRDIIEICGRIARIPGISEVCITTNGVLLAEMAKELREAGVSNINMSLDTLNPERYKEITGLARFEDVLRGIDAAKSLGFNRLKINTVLIGGFNDDEIYDFVELTRERDVHVRFIELMPMGACAKWDRNCFISADSVFEEVPELKPLGNDGVALLYGVPGYDGTVGLIRPMSRHFCPNCNRIRVTADGKLKPCLHSSEEINIRELSGYQLQRTIERAIAAKPQRHHLSPDNPSEAVRNMNEIGG